MSIRAAIRKHIVFILLLLVIVCVSACQPTPDIQIVVGKNQEQMIEAAKQTQPPGQEQDDLTLSERLSVPQRYTVELTEDKLRILVNAEVIFPDTDKVPMFKVSAADFTQEHADGLIKAMFNGETLYEWESGELRMTKEEVERMLIIWRQRKASSDEEFASKEGQEWCDSAIERFEQEYLTASEENNVIVSDGILKPRDLINHETGEKAATYYGLIAFTGDESDKPARFFIENNNDLKEPIKYKDGGFTAVERNAILRYNIHSDDIGSNDNYWMSSPIPVDSDTVITDEKVLEKLKTTPKEAQKLAENMLKIADIDYMTLYSMSLVDNANDGSVDDIVSPAALYAYRLQFVRVVDGIHCAYMEGTAASEDNTTYSAFWNYETLDIYIDDRGIFKLEWNSPLEVKDNITSDAAMLTFDSIEEKFADMMRITYLPESKAGGRTETTINIDRVSLELFRITEQNSIENGLLVPVWNFYGTKTITYDDKEYSEGLGVPVSLLIINAIDGNIIDLSKGY